MQPVRVVHHLAVEERLRRLADGVAHRAVDLGDGCRCSSVDEEGFLLVEHELAAQRGVPMDGLDRALQAC
ncbi:hypothetical protein [Auritidibacter ignavus]|uniref:hypothetical protein n=1 Tax=Auritidibacter ignavus TaxID=678932 RepID=UPI0024BB0EF2|nr:hypothetical protein [Auritidibacter ignavus]WHS29089.1 hypothetical protein QM395_05035 [Auritidibacter ignavus]